MSPEPSVEDSSHRPFHPFRVQRAGVRHSGSLVAISSLNRRWNTLLVVGARRVQRFRSKHSMESLNLAHSRCYRHWFAAAFSWRHTISLFYSAGASEIRRVSNSVFFVGTGIPYALRPE